MKWSPSCLEKALDLSRTLLQVNNNLQRAVAEELLAEETITFDDMRRLQKAVEAEA
jgi:hypothetical protein